MSPACSVALALACGTLAASSLPEQSISLLLDRSFPEQRLSYLLLDAPTGRLICSRWNDAQQSVPVGSLVKPFTALAYGRTHGFVFPEFTCKGAQDRCWLPQGHGRIGLTEAIAHSCNAYFLALANEVNPDAIAGVAQEFGLKPPDSGADGASLMGLGGQWTISPISIARAYSELRARSGEAGVREIMKGMSLSARIGTGSGVGSSALAKTGTASCIHSPSHPGDGYTLAIFPADSPRFTLLVRVEGVPGADAARTAGRMRALLEGGLR
jgi:cell division protein FtsI/penicillin-binding protein 2